MPASDKHALRMKGKPSLLRKLNGNVDVSEAKMGVCKTMALVAMGLEGTALSE